MSANPRSILSSLHPDSRIRFLKASHWQCVGHHTQTSRRSHLKLLSDAPNIPEVQASPQVPVSLLQIFPARAVLAPRARPPLTRPVAPPAHPAAGMRRPSASGLVARDLRSACQCLLVTQRHHIRVASLGPTAWGQRLPRGDYLVSFFEYLPQGAPKTNPTRPHLPEWCEPDPVEQPHFESPAFNGDLELRGDTRKKVSRYRYGAHQEPLASIS